VTNPQLTRARLLERLRASRIGVVEAGGGYGKSVLGDQLRSMLGIPTARIGLRERHADPGLIPPTIVDALRAARLSDLVAAVEGKSSIGNVVDSLLDGLSAMADPVLLLVDDAHLLEGDGQSALERLTAELPASHRMVVLGRSMTFLRPALRHIDDATLLNGQDLAFSAEETE
jgi:ATP/maltotriose-dependent transcriptional regulator MalT